MIIGIIADTHDNIRNTEKAIQHFRDEGADVILHAGDFVAPPLIALFTGIKTIAVLGNSDGDVTRLLSKAREVGVDLKGEYAELEYDGLKFALYHGTNTETTEALILSKAYDVVISGHSHHAEEKKTGNTIFINPGTAHGFGARATIAVFDTQTRQTRIIDL